MSADWRRDDVERLHGLGYHLLPTDGDKRPGAKWRLGGIDYVKVQPTRAKINRWEAMAVGWAVTCGGPLQLVTYDVEAEGMADKT